MSGNSTIPAFSYADPGDVDTYAEDCTAEMNRRGTTLQSVANPIITRTDGVPVGAGELTVTAVTVIKAGLAFAWTASGGIAGATYQLRFQLTLGSSGPIWRSVTMPILGAVG